MTGATAVDHTGTLQEILSRRLGLTFDDSHLPRLAEVLEARARATTSGDFAHYLKRLDTDEFGESELGQLADQLTVGETYFFRHPEQLRVFSEIALPERLNAHTAGNPVRILSAGCASGEEPYTLAILACEVLGYIPAEEIKVTAFDVSPMMIEKARRATYSDWALRATSEDRKGRYFRRENGQYLLHDSVRSMVRLDVENLLGESSAISRGPVFDIIFFRNVAIYFSSQAQKAAIDQLTRWLMPDGYLFLGPSETLRGVSTRFHLLHKHDAFYYRLADEGARTAELRRVPSCRQPAVAGVSSHTDPDLSWARQIHGVAERISLLRGHQRGQHTPEQEQRSITVTDNRRERGTHLEVAHSLLREERFDDALAHLQGAGENADTLLLQAVLSVNRGHIEQAENLCKGLLALDELSCGAHYLLALCREHVGDRSGSTEHDLVAIYLDAEFAMPHLHLGMLTKRSGDLTTAEHEFRQALTLLEREDPARILLFGGGFSRETLIALCRAELETCGGAR